MLHIHRGPRDSVFVNKPLSQYWWSLCPSSADCQSNGFWSLCCYRPHTKFAKVLFGFTSVCFSVHRGGLHPGVGRWANLPSDAMWYGQRAGATYPSGMHSCCWQLFGWCLRYSNTVVLCSGGFRIFLRGCQLPKWAYLTIILQIFCKKTAWKWKNLDSEGGVDACPLGHSLELPMVKVANRGWIQAGTRYAPRSNFYFHFHSIFGNNFQNNSFALKTPSTVDDPPQKILDPSLQMSAQFLQKEYYSWLIYMNWIRYTDFLKSN